MLQIFQFPQNFNQFHSFQLKELLELADKFFVIFERCGPTLRDAYLSTMRKQKNGRIIDDLIKEAIKT